LLFSTINFIYLVSVKPLEDRKQNRIEYFNELTIMLCSHIYNIFLRGEGTIGFIGVVGWTFMGAAAINILGNMGVVLFETLNDAGGKIMEFKEQKNKEKLMETRKKNREIIVKEAPGEVTIFEFELQLNEAISTVRLWIPQRQWLKKNNVGISGYKEEIQF